ncbi:MAG TPA: hypothetical protein VFA54_08750 [Bryobacterales bacterium]|nr:hypothetical protein [Bryobacterales bacterium]
MRRIPFWSILFGLLVASSLRAVEIATGMMLGLRYDPDAFYFRTAENPAWRKTYTGKGYRGEARGKLMNVRLAQALFEDEWLSERPFDAAANTARVIDALDFYKRHGVLAISVGLQGADPGYAPNVNGITRQSGPQYGRSGGTLVSAFRPDGSLKPAWLARLESLLRAADQRGMFVCLIYFYPGLDVVFDSPETIEAGARQMTDWLIDHKFRNVIIDVADEWDAPGQKWDQSDYIPQNVGGMIERIRERFQAKRADFTLPIGASASGRMLYPASLAEISDVVLLHGNGRAPAEKADRAQQYKAYQRPLLMTGDDNGRETTLSHLAREQASCEAFFRHGAGWGYTPWVQAERFPFYYLPGPSPDFTDQTPVAERDRAYFHAVLDAMARFVLEKPPEGKKWKSKP